MWLRDLSSALSKDPDVVLVYLHVWVAFFAILYRKVFFLHYRTVAVISNLAVYHQKGDSIPFRWLIDRLTFILTLKCANGIIYHPNEELSAFVRRNSHCSLALPAVLIDTDSIKAKPDSGENLRSKLGLSGKKVVGIVGPFHRFNRFAIDYVHRNLSKFSGNIVFLFVGSYDRRDIVNDSRIYFLGHVSDISEALSACDCVLMPRPMKSGGIPGKMLYAMSVGLPVVTDNPEWVRVINFQNAVVTTMDELINTINILCQNEELKRTVGAGAREFVVRNYSFRAALPALKLFFDELQSSDS